MSLPDPSSVDPQTGIETWNTYPRVKEMSAGD